MTADEYNERRAEILRDLGATTEDVAELLPYADSGFGDDALGATRDYPLPDEEFVDAWQRVQREATSIGTIAALKRTLIQLQFAVEQGMSTRPAYQAATRRGVLSVGSADAGALFTDPDHVMLSLHPTAAGRLPVIVAESRPDFELLVRALTRRNEPEALPASMGASIVGGYNNWSRIAAMRHEWANGNPELAHDDAAWGVEFARIVPQRARYQDRLVLLSSGPYSDTPAHAVGESVDEWRRLSLIIRLEHECAHYFTRRVFGSMRNALLDELIADYTGIVAARGRFEPEWLIRFMGVEHTRLRPGGRLMNYRGTPPLSDSAFCVLQEMVRRAAHTLDAFDAMVRCASPHTSQNRTLDQVAAAITAIARVGLERLIAPDGARAMHAEFEACLAHGQAHAVTS